MNADNFDFSGDPGTPNTAPRAKDPTARLYDGSITSNGPAARCVVREHDDDGVVSGADDVVLIGSTDATDLDLELSRASEDVVVKALAAPHTKKRSEMSLKRFIVMMAARAV